MRLRKEAEEAHSEASRLEEAATQESDAAAKAALVGQAAQAREKAEEHQANAAKIVDMERRRNWHVQDKFNHAQVNVEKLEIGSRSKKQAAAHPGSSSKGGQWTVINDPTALAPGAALPASDAAAAAPAGEHDHDEDEEDDEEALDAYVADMEKKAQEFGVLGNDEDCFERSYTVIQKFPEIVVKESTDYLLLVGNDLVRGHRPHGAVSLRHDPDLRAPSLRPSRQAKRGEEELGRAFVHQSLIMQYCMDLSVGGANGPLQFFKRMNAPDPKQSKAARAHFEQEFEDYWGKILERARRIRKENEAKAAQQVGASIPPVTQRRVATLTYALVPLESSTRRRWRVSSNLRRPAPLPQPLRESVRQSLRRGIRARGVFAYAGPRTRGGKK